MQPQPTMQRIVAPLLLLLLLATTVTDATRVAFRYDGLEHASCSSGTFDMELSRLTFSCNGEESLCRPGDTALVQGQFEANSAMPMDVTVRTKACKYFGTWCTPTLGFNETSIADEWNIYSRSGNDTYPNPGFYNFEKSFDLPSNRLTNSPFAGFHFNLVSDMQADDTSHGFVPHLRCHARFTTVDYDKYRENGDVGSGFFPSFGNGSFSGFGSWSMLGLVSLMGGAGFMERKRRLQSAEAARPALTLNDDHDSDNGNGVATDFEMMPTHHFDGDDQLSARV